MYIIRAVEDHISNECRGIHSLFLKAVSSSGLLFHSLFLSFPPKKRERKTISIFFFRFYIMYKPEAKEEKREHQSIIKNLKVSFLSFVVFFFCCCWWKSWHLNLLRIPGTHGLTLHSNNHCPFSEIIIYHQLKIYLAIQASSGNPMILPISWDLNKRRLLLILLLLRCLAQLSIRSKSAHAD